GASVVIREENRPRPLERRRWTCTATLHANKNANNNMGIRSKSSSSSSYNKRPSFNSCSSSTTNMPISCSCTSTSTTYRSSSSSCTNTYSRSKASTCTYSLGGLNLLNLTDEVSESFGSVTADSIFVHPDYHPENEQSNNLAILKLSQPVTFSPQVQAIRLFNGSSTDVSAGSVTAYGIPESFDAFKCGVAEVTTTISPTQASSTQESSTQESSTQASSSTATTALTSTASATTTSTKMKWGREDSTHWDDGRCLKEIFMHFLHLFWAKLGLLCPHPEPLEPPVKTHTTALRNKRLSQIRMKFCGKNDSVAGN
ncbi:unnamed protein product, partial [Notodromas monacha]